MPQSLSNVLVHMAFSTKERRPMLRAPALRAEMHKLANQGSRSAATLAYVTPDPSGRRTGSSVFIA